MPTIRLALQVRSEKYAICRLDADTPTPGWAESGTFYSISRSPEELSIVCPEEFVPEGILAEKGWRCLSVQGPLSFSQVGALATLLSPLAGAQVGILTISTYDTDHIFVREQDLELAVHTLSAAGHLVARH